MIIRPAEPADAMAVAGVHVRAWQAAYRGVMPDDYLDGLRPQERAQRYDFNTRDPARPQTLVALEGAALLGFATIAPARDPEAAGQGELCALYVEPASWGRGVGRSLAAAARAALATLGFREAILWVVADNARARRFYEADGWSLDEVHRSQQVWSVTVDTVRYRRNL